VDDPRAVSDRSALPKPVETAETSKLLERASALLRQGDIGAARLILAFAQDSGSPRAAFMLAETYDPQMLSAWKALGTHADARKARELYAKAYAGGIAEAKARFDALPK
jgi:TPR repeat protein